MLSFIGQHQVCKCLLQVLKDVWLVLFFLLLFQVTLTANRSIRSDLSAKLYHETRRAYANLIKTAPFYICNKPITICLILVIHAALD